METEPETEQLYRTGGLDICGDEDTLIESCQRHGVWLKREAENGPNTYPTYEFLGTESALTAWLLDCYGLEPEEVDDFLYAV